MNMRVFSPSKYSVYLCLLLPVVFLVLYYVTLYHTPGKKAYDIGQEKQLQEKLKKAIPNRAIELSPQLTNLVQENQGLLEKLKSDMFQQRKAMLDKVRYEISAESVVQEKEKALEQRPTHKPATVKLVEPAKPAQVTKQGVIPIIITACNRPSVSRCLDKLLSVRGQSADTFPIVVSQDCGDKATADVLASYGDKITFIKHAPEPVPAGVSSHMAGYYKISSHYKFALSQGFQLFPKAESIIILEDDIEVSPDFLTYFYTMNELLKKDPSLWCASAWNDNGKTNQVDLSEKGAEILYRSDFFPGLGWLLKRSLWENELASKWPAGFWDDWMRDSEQRKGRACIRPEVSRTSTFGRKGVSQGQFFDTHLKYIKLNEFPVDWETKDLSYLMKEAYDKSFKEKVYQLPLATVSDLKENKNPDAREVRVEYTTSHTFKALATELGLMTDFKDGVPRTAYMGIVSTLFHDRRVYLSPPPSWTGYDKSWT